MNYSVRFRLYTTLVGIIVLTILFYNVRAAYNNAFDLAATAVPVSDIGTPPTNALIAINNHYGDGNDPLSNMPSKLITLTGEVVRESNSGIPFEYDVESQKITPNNSESEYEPLMISVENKGNILSDYTAKYEGALNPLKQRSIVLVNNKSLQRSILVHWRKIFATELIDVIALDTKPETEWFGIVQNNHLFITKRGSGKHALISEVPFTRPDDMRVYEIEVFFGKE